MRPANQTGRPRSQRSRPASAKRSGSRSSRPRSTSPVKREKTKSQPNFLFETGTLGSGFQSMTLSGSARDTFAPQYSFRGIPTETFVQMVRQTFRKAPEVYKKFAQILSEVEHKDTDKLDLVKRVITLFHGYPHLIEGFNSFLPSDYSIEIQDHAVIIKVFDTFGTNSVHVNTGHVRSVESLKWDDLEYRSDESSDKALRYTQQVKEMCADQPQRYRQFLDILRDFHGQHVDKVETIHQIVCLFRQYPHLIVGFNAFLPDGFHIYVTDDGYDVEYPGENEGERTIVRFKK